MVTAFNKNALGEGRNVEESSVIYSVEWPACNRRCALLLKMPSGDTFDSETTEDDGRAMAGNFVMVMATETSALDLS